MKAGIISIGLLMLSNIFMTLAWYGHLYFKNTNWIIKGGLFGIIILSWGFAFFEYLFQVPANKIGFLENGGPYNLFQLKLIQEVISLSIFTLFAIYIFKTDKLQWNYIVAFLCIILAVFFIFYKK